jgi:NAD(P)-dependent dehydrogenase (short-subunit alcohol dehydrogenase family)
MATVFITGSADGLGLMAGELLASQGHSVVLHARNEARARDARAAVQRAAAVLVGDSSTLSAMRTVADQANSFGRFDAVIHNVGIGYREPRRVTTEDGLSQLWAVNVLAPYVLTALMERAGRVVYLSSGMHMGGDASLEDLQWENRRWNGSQAYADTKFQDVLLAFGIAVEQADRITDAWAAWITGGNLNTGGASPSIFSPPTWEARPEAQMQMAHRMKVHCDDAMRLAGINATPKTLPLLIDAMYDKVQPAYMIAHQQAEQSKPAAPETGLPRLEKALTPVVGAASLSSLFDAWKVVTHPPWRELPLDTVTAGSIHDNG